MLTNNNSEQETGTERTGECFSMPGGQYLTLPLETLTNNSNKRSRTKGQKGQVSSSLSSGIQCQTLLLKTLTTTNKSTSSNQESGRERTGECFSQSGGHAVSDLVAEDIDEQQEQ